MKLRHKKTGAVANYRIILQRKAGNGSNKAPIRYGCGSLTKLNENWEDYIPKEPLIKDEKIRKAVRAWAEANDVDEVLFEYWWDSDVSAEMIVEDAYERNIYVKFNVQRVICNVNQIYTIEELCGEEECES